MTIESIGCKEQIKTPAASLLRKFKVLPLSTNIISCFPSLFPLRIRVCSPLAFPLSCRLGYIGQLFLLDFSDSLHLQVLALLVVFWRVGERFDFEIQWWR